MWIRRRQTDYTLCGCNHSISSYNEFKSGGGNKKSRTSLWTLATPPPKKKTNCHLKQIAEQKVGDIFFFWGGLSDSHEMSFWTMLEPGHPVATFGSGTARRGPRCETPGARGSGGSRASCAAWPGGGAPNVVENGWIRRIFLRISWNTNYPPGN